MKALLETSLKITDKLEADVSEIALFTIEGAICHKL